MTAESVGTIIVGTKQHKITIKNVLYVPELKSNLLSVRRLAEKGLSVIFTENNITIKRKNEVIVQGYPEGLLYKIHLHLETTSRSENSCLMTSTVNWHRKLGHVNKQSLQILEKKGLLNKLEISDLSCEVCIKGKMCRLPYRKKGPLQLIHSDVCCPITRSGTYGHKYFVTFLNDYTHFTMVFGISKKSDVLKCFKEKVDTVKLMGRLDV